VRVAEADILEEESLCWKALEPAQFTDPPPLEPCPNLPLVTVPPKVPRSVYNKKPLNDEEPLTVTVTAAPASVAPAVSTVKPAGRVRRGGGIHSCRHHFKVSTRVTEYWVDLVRSRLSCRCTEME
jgi:hypothetical protein